METWVQYLKLGFEALLYLGLTIILLVLFFGLVVGIPMMLWDALKQEKPIGKEIK